MQSRPPPSAARTWSRSTRRSRPASAARWPPRAPRWSSGPATPTPSSCSSARRPASRRTSRACRSLGGRASCWTSCWRAWGSTRDEVFITNVLKSRPPGNRDPQPEEIEACRPYLDRQIELIEPTRDLHARELRHQAAHPLSAAGSRKSGAAPRSTRSAGAPCALYPLYHPAAALRTTRMLEELGQDFAASPGTSRRSEGRAARLRAGCRPPSTRADRRGAPPDVDHLLDRAAIADNSDCIHGDSHFRHRRHVRQGVRRAHAAGCSSRTRTCREMLRLGRSRVDVSVRTLMMIDSLEMTDADRALIVAQLPPVRRAADRHHARHRHHGRDRRGAGAGAWPGKTIVLTGAMIPYAFGSSDGLFNLGSALSFAQVLPPGVYVAMNGTALPVGPGPQEHADGLLRSRVIGPRSYRQWPGWRRA